MATGALEAKIQDSSTTSQANNIVEVDFTAREGIPAPFSAEKMSGMINSLRNHLYLQETGMCLAANEVNWWEVYKTLLPAGEECALGFSSAEYHPFFESAVRECPELVPTFLRLLQQIVSLASDDYTLPDVSFPAEMPEKDREKILTDLRMNMHQMNVLSYIIKRVLSSESLITTNEA